MYTATSEKTYRGQYATDVITDRALAFLGSRPKDKPFFLMVHHKAPHRPWEPDSAHGAQFASRRIPEPVTFWDAYATRTDALHQNQQRVATDLTNRDLKIVPPFGLDSMALIKVALRQAGVRDDRHRGAIGDAHRRGARALERSTLHAGLSRDGAVGR